MARRDHGILERAVHSISEPAANTSKVVDEAMDAGLAADHPVTVAAKMLRLELLKVKADLERELGTFVLNCSACGLDVHWVSGLRVAPGYWAQREPAPHGKPAGSRGTDFRLGSDPALQRRMVPRPSGARPSEVQPRAGVRLGTLLASVVERSRRKSVVEDARIGTAVGSYRLLSQIGRGSMSVVYLAVDQQRPRSRERARNVHHPD